MEFTRTVVPPAQNKKGVMSLDEVRYIEQYEDIFWAARCYGLVQMDRFLSVSQAATMYSKIAMVTITGDHIFITYDGKRFTLSNQFLGWEFGARLDKRTPPECNVDTLTNEEVVEFLRQPGGFLNPWKIQYGTITNQAFGKVGASQEAIPSYDTRESVLGKRSDGRTHTSDPPMEGLLEGYDRSQNMPGVSFVVCLCSVRTCAPHVLK